MENIIMGNITMSNNSFYWEDEDHIDETYTTKLLEIINKKTLTEEIREDNIYNEIAVEIQDFLELRKEDLIGKYVDYLERILCKRMGREEEFYEVENEVYINEILRLKGERKSINGTALQKQEIEKLINRQYHKDNKRSFIFKMAFILGLSCEETEECLKKGLKESGFNSKNPEEVVYRYCLKKELGLKDANRIIERLQTEFCSDIIKTEQDIYTDFENNFCNYEIHGKNLEEPKQAFFKQLDKVGSLSVITNRDTKSISDEKAIVEKYIDAKDDELLEEIRKKNFEYKKQNKRMNQKNEEREYLLLTSNQIDSMVKFLLGDSKSVSRDDCFKLAYVLGLSAEDTDNFLQSATDQHRGFDVKNSDEMIHWYCLKNNQEYQDACTLMKDYKKHVQTKKRSNTIPGRTFEIYGRGYSEKNNEDELLTFLRTRIEEHPVTIDNNKTMKPYDSRRRKVFLENLKIIQNLDSTALSQSEYFEEFNASRILKNIYGFEISSSTLKKDFKLEKYVLEETLLLHRLCDIINGSEPTKSEFLLMHFFAFFSKKGIPIDDNDRSDYEDARMKLLNQFHFDNDYNNTNNTYEYFLRLCLSTPDPIGVFQAVYKNAHRGL